ncbi:hypothetical protein LQT18_15695 [Escherichia coli]|nr:hypothetical protein LQT18_15695 [Escherichia coli]
MKSGTTDISSPGYNRNNILQEHWFTAQHGADCSALTLIGIHEHSLNDDFYVLHRQNILPITEHASGTSGLIYSGFRYPGPG